MMGTGARRRNADFASRSIARSLSSVRMGSTCARSAIHVRAGDVACRVVGQMNSQAREWWSWRKSKRGYRTLAVERGITFSAEVDYRSRISMRVKDLSTTLSVIAKHFGEPVGRADRGSMTMFATAERPRDILYSQLIVTPPVFHIDTMSAMGTIGVRELRTDERFPIWIQPWLHHHGKRGIFYTVPYDQRRGYGDLELFPIETFEPYNAVADVRDHIAVAVDAFLQRGQPDERFQDGPEDGEHAC